MKFSNALILVSFIFAAQEAAGQDMVMDFDADTDENMVEALEGDEATLQQVSLTKGISNIAKKYSNKYNNNAYKYNQNNKNIWNKKATNNKNNNFKKNTNNNDAIDGHIHSANCGHNSATPCS